MKNSIQAFLARLIDYAGYFPPEDLSLRQALKNYIEYRSGSDHWMLSRVIVPYRKLSDLTDQHGDLLDNLDEGAVSVLGSGTESQEEFCTMIDQLVEACRSFPSKSSGIPTDFLETKLPTSDIPDDPQAVQSIIHQTRETFAQDEDTPDQVFLETYLHEDWKKRVRVLLQAITEVRERYEDAAESISMGMKLRCGGQSPDMVPSVQQVAFVVNQARDHDVPLKCTAGLHHPVRTYDSSIPASIHGFFNVFGGAMCAHEYQLDQSELEEILKIEDHSRFQFSDDAFHCGEYSVDVERIKALREARLVSFGSCSFDEPREDLRALDYLE